MNWQIIVGLLLLIGGIANITSNLGAFLFGLVAGGGLLFWGLKKKGFRFKSGSTGNRQLKDEKLRAVGVSYYEKNIEKLAYRNPAWDRSTAEIISAGDSGRRIFQHNYTNRPVKLVMENNNPNDKNAVAVYIAGELVGYISREENAHVRDILQDHEIKSLSAFIGGGQYKVVSVDQQVSKDALSFTVTIRIQYI